MTILLITIVGTAIATASANIVWGSFFEWWLHKNMMHKVFWGIRYPFETHGITHHTLYGADETYHYHDQGEAQVRPNIFDQILVALVAGLPFWLIGTLSFASEHRALGFIMCMSAIAASWAAFMTQRSSHDTKITMGPLNWIPIVFFGGSPFWVTTGLSEYFGFHTVAWTVTYTALATSLAMYLLYEGLHWVMHMPGSFPWVERRKFFIHRNGHHLLHHKYPGKNFNMIVLIADKWMGTLRTEAKKPFNQARGLSLPDVQPKQTRTV